MRLKLKLFLVSVILLATTLTSWLAAPRAPISFDTSADLRSFVESQDLQTRNDGVVQSTYFFIADHPVTTDDMVLVSTRQDCGLTASWRGIVWVGQIRATSSVMYPTQGFGGKWRIWGNVVVAGDEELMDRIEELYRNQ
jgi:hypothetical protein